MAKTNKPHQPFINGERVYLREVRLEDVNDNYYQWLNDSGVNQFLETRYIPRSKQNIQSYVQSMDGNAEEPFLAICLKGTHKHIGNIKLGPINWLHRFADISLVIGDKNSWAKGIATECIRLITRFAFDTLNLNKLHAGCYAQNVGSKKAFLKAGFKQEGVLEKKRIVNGHFQDEFLLGLHVTDWRKKKHPRI